MDVRNLRPGGAGVAQAERELGRINILVNNAGINRPAAAMEVTEENWNDHFNTNVKGGFFVAQAAAKGMIARKWGRVIFISSQSGLIGIPGQPVYCSTKGAVIQLVRTLGIEWAKHGVTVNSVAPTFVETNMTRDAPDQPGFREIRAGQDSLRQAGSTPGYRCRRRLSGQQGSRDGQLRRFAWMAAGRHGEGQTSPPRIKAPHVHAGLRQVLRQLVRKRGRRIRQILSLCHGLRKALDSRGDVGGDGFSAFALEDERALVANAGQRRHERRHIHLALAEGDFFAPGLSRMLRSDGILEMHLPDMPAEQRGSLPAVGPRRT